MKINAKVIKGKYLDSVKLMLLSKELKNNDGIEEAVVIVATSENKAILRATGMLLPEFEDIPESSIYAALKSDSEQLNNKLLSEIDTMLDRNSASGGDNEKEMPISLENAVKLMPDANMALISVAGKYAGIEARKALDNNLNVMLFSDNVSLEIEKELKELAVSKGLLMMGPDCGTAIINTVPLAFANKVRKGQIGIVAGAGTGLQAVCCEIDRQGAGVSQAFGTGGRDGKKYIGGLMTLHCLQFLIDDPATKVIVIISKLPDTEVLNKIWKLVETTDKPIVVNFLKECSVPAHIHSAITLAGTAKKAVGLLFEVAGDRSVIPEQIPAFAGMRGTDEIVKADSGKYLRGLFSGGTLCYEAQNIFKRKTGSYPFSNTPIEEQYLLGDVWKSKENTMLDLGSDEFTVGRPHPMIDFSLRIKKIEEEMNDNEVGVILLDVVLGYGAHQTPHKELTPLIKQGKKKFVCAVIGTENDPQNKQEVITALVNAGALVFDSNSDACEAALKVLGVN